ncbi:MAG: type 2 isopentenyl-diphosphate Delta-isomerase [Candidatus Hadarchaeia archaeon]
MIDIADKTSERKLDHIEICLEEDVESRFKSTGFEDIDLIHQASAEVNLSDINTTARIFGKEIEAPILISPMTGGHERGKKINRTMARAARELGIGMCVGSQRAGLGNEKLTDTYQVRDIAPEILLMGNLGIAQLSDGYGLKKAREAIEMIGADALGIHLNSLQEAIQPEGETDLKKGLKGFSRVASELDKPVYVKETGAGITGKVARKFEDAGSSAIDVSGAGGTSWAGVEQLRSSEGSTLGDVFWDWGIPTSVSTAEVAKSVDIPVIASGGIRTGIDAAKAIALGADFVGVALPLIRASVKGKKAVVRWLKEFISEIKTAMFLTKSSDIKELKKSPLSIAGNTKDLFISRGLKPKDYR